MSFDWEHSVASAIPINLGFGRVFSIAGQEIDAYVQPEWGLTRHSYNPTIPRFTRRFQVNLLFLAKPPQS